MISDLEMGIGLSDLTGCVIDRNSINTSINFQANTNYCQTVSN